MYIYEHIYTFVHSVKIVAKETVIILNQELPTVLHAKRDLIYESLQLGLVNCREGAKAFSSEGSVSVHGCSRPWTCSLGKAVSTLECFQFAQLHSFHCIFQSGLDCLFHLVA